MLVLALQAKVSVSPVSSYQVSVGNTTVRVKARRTTSLHFVTDDDDPYWIVKKLMNAVPAGRFLVIVRAPGDLYPEEIAEQTRHYNAWGTERMRPGSQQEIQFFDGLN
jgi:hypothetical protein